MPTTLTWQAITVRLVLTVVCAGALGLDRDERGHAAGLRTNLLVGLAACVAMIQANWLINSNGKPEDSYVVMDIMRLPLGILSGIGFIGAGAIVKRGELALGVTTAATIWFVTVMGLCFGGGQVALGFVGFVMAMIFLTLFRKMESHIPQQHSAMLKVTVPPGGLRQEEIASRLLREGISLSEPSLCSELASTANRIYGWKLQWKGERKESEPPRVIKELAAQQDIVKLELTR